MTSTNSGASAADPAFEQRPEPKLLDRVREAVRLRHYSRRTEEAYVAWGAHSFTVVRGCQAHHSLREPIRIATER
jgi:hypothetical protein